MKIKHALLAAAALFVATSSFGQEKIKDVRTKPDLYFLQIGEVANSLKLLPPPPQPGSILWLNDVSQYQWGKMQRNTERGDQAVQMQELTATVCPTPFLMLSVFVFQKKQHPKYIN